MKGNIFFIPMTILSFLSSFMYMTMDLDERWYSRFALGTILLGLMIIYNKDVGKDE